MSTDLLIGSSASGKTEICIKRIQNIKSTQPLSKVWVIVPDSQNIFYFRQRLAKAGGSIGVNVGTFSAIYNHILEKNGVFTPVITPSLEYRLLQKTIEEAYANNELTYYSEIMKKPGFIQAGSNVISELRSAYVTPDQFQIYTQSCTKAKQELGTDKVTIELLTSDNALAKKTGEYLKGELEKNLDGLTVNLKPQPRKQQLKLLLSGDYEIGIDGWGPDFADPITFLDLFTTDSAYNFDKYSNKEYDELIHKVKTDLAGDEKARFEAMKQAEKILLQDGAVAPLYQQGRSYLQRSFIKGLVTTDFGGEFNYKWTEVTK